LFGAEPQQDDLMRSLSWLAEQAETVRVYRQAHPPAKDAPVADPGLDALASLCQVLCSSNRFLYVE
jgi:hypothetical protein